MCGAVVLLTTLLRNEEIVGRGGGEKEEGREYGGQVAVTCLPSPPLARPERDVYGATPIPPL